MKRTTNRILLPLLAACLLCACGSTYHLTTGVPGAIIMVHDSLSVQGALLNETDTTVTIVAFGVPATYHKSAVKSIQHAPVPDWPRVLAEADQNAEAAANSAGALLVLTILSVASAVIIVVAQ